MNEMGYLKGVWIFNPDPDYSATQMEAEPLTEEKYWEIVARRAREKWFKENKY